MTNPQSMESTLTKQEQILDQEDDPFKELRVKS
jgi:hypothetical protein